MEATGERLRELGRLLLASSPPGSRPGTWVGGHAQARLPWGLVSGARGWAMALLGPVRRRAVVCVWG